MSRALQDMLAAYGRRPQGTVTGREIAVWWRLAFRDGSYETEPFDHASIRLGKRGARALQLVASPDAPEGSGLMEVPLRPGEEPVFYRVRSLDADGSARAPGSNCDAVVYGRGFDGGQGIDAELWCVRPDSASLENVVPRQWFDQDMVELQVTEWGA